MINTGFPDKIALVTNQGEVSYSELFRHIQQYADLFPDHRGEKIAIFATNRAEWIYAFYAGWVNGCAVVTIDAGASPDDVAYILRDCQPTLIFTADEQISVLNQAIDLCGIRPVVISFDQQAQAPLTQKVFSGFSYDPAALAVIIYTSGTTGYPKGVMLSYQNLLANVQAVSEKIPIFRPERQVLVLLPLHHIFPLAGSMMAPLYIGGTVVMAPSMQASDILSTMQKNRVNIMIGVPRLYELLYKSIFAKIKERKVAHALFKLLSFFNARSLIKKVFKQVHQGLGGHLEILVAGGAALDPVVGNFFYKMGFEVLEGFGMTEAAPMITFTRPGKVRIGSTGQVLPGLKLEVRDGELVASGPNIMMGYYNNPEETAEVLKDGWLYTGDLGEIDRKGYVRITGRKKEIIVLANGKNISPVELELKLAATSPLIKEVAVFLDKDLLHALIVCDNQQLREKAIDDAKQYFRKQFFPLYNSQVSSYKRINKFTLIDTEIPRTRLGKIQRFLLPALAGNVVKQKKQEVKDQGPVYAALSEYMTQVTGAVIHPDAHLEYDLALDSLAKISIIDFIEKNYGITLTEREFAQFGTMGAMVSYVDSHKKFSKHQEVNWSDIIREKVHLKLPKTWPTFMLIKSTALSFFSVYFRFSARGIKNLPEGPCIIAPNHQSFFDGLFVASFLKPRTMNKTYFFAKKKHVNTHFLSFMAKTNNVIVVDSSTDVKESIQKMAQVLKKGKKIIVFPEGTRTHNGTLGEFKRTFAILSKELEVPVVPVAIDGAYRALPRGSIFPRPFTRVRVNFMRPVYPQNYTVDGIMQKTVQLIKKRLGYTEKR
jgi:long-chain acyl-CoA synthetase